MQVLLATVLVNALHPALEDAEKALNRVRIDRSGIRTMVDGFSPPINVWADACLGLPHTVPSC